MDQNGEAATVSHRLEDTAGPSDTTAAPRLKCLSCRRGCLSIFSVTYCVLYSLPTALFASAKRKPPTPPPPPTHPPTPFPLEFTGSLPRHGNDVIERKKWNAARMKNTVVLYSIHPPPYHPSETRQRATPPSLPCCLPAAVQGYEMVTSLAVTSLSLNLTQ